MLRKDGIEDFLLLFVFLEALKLLLEAFLKHSVSEASDVDWNKIFKFQRNLAYILRNGLGNVIEEINRNKSVIG